MLRSHSKAMVLIVGFVMSFAGTLVFGTPAKADIADQCLSKCGPAPCCKILWVTFCGCPWGEEQEIQ